MKDEVAKAEWKDLKDLKSMNFTPMAKNVCRILLCEQELKENKADISTLPLGDLFRTTSLTPEDYQLFSKNKDLFNV